MKLFVYIVFAYAVALALAGLVLSGFGAANYTLGHLNGGRMTAFVLAFTAGIALMHWFGPPRFLVSVLGWVGLYVMFLIVAVATDETAAGLLMALTIIGVIPFFGLFAAALGVAYWALTALAFGSQREELAFSRILGVNPLGVFWLVLALPLFVALGFEMMLGDTERVYDFLRLAVRPLGFDWYSYGGEQTAFRILLLGLMGMFGVVFARLFKAEPPLPTVLGFMLGGALVAQLWNLPIYHPTGWGRALDVYAGPFPLLIGATYGAMCGAAWYGVGYWRESVGASRG